MPTQKTNDEKRSSTQNKTQGNKTGKSTITRATMPSSPSATSKARDMDIKRRSDAESNEL